ncbi:hypothetical protein Taro_025135 [Colocasia esculenta]|uniref:Uncharacterized protein n=1 Tax=Colocasia esculenta TaxID=4460 RepID=A0A843V2F5_COLES|nr:hypothetical protein [Colocasia esculenta]
MSNDSSHNDFISHAHNDFFRLSTVLCIVYHKHSFMLTLSSMLTDLKDHQSLIKTNEEEMSNG